MQTKLIKWEGKQMIAAVHSAHVPIIFKICKEKNVKIYGSHTCGIWTIPKEDALAFNTECPDEVYIKKLTAEHAERVNSLWPHRFPESVKYVQHILELNDGYGIFLKSNNELVSWAIMSHFGAIAYLQTVDEHTRKGYAALITKFVGKKFAEIGMDPYGTVITRNTTSQGIFSKIGFQAYEECVYFEILTD